VLPRLERLAAEHLAADGLDPRHLAVVSGALDGVERLLGSWLAVGDRVVVEDPGYTAVLDLVAAMGFVPVPLPLDDTGVRPGPLAEALRRGADAVVLTPRAQNPTGTAWDEGRAARLAGIFRRHPEVLVVEDDHAGPVAAVPAVSACRGLTRWAVVRSVSKWLGPDMRLGMLIGDETTVARVEGRQALGIGWVSYVLQGMVADLLEDPGTRRSLAHATSVYERRRGALLHELRTRGLAATGNSGLTTWVPVADEDGVTARLAAAGWAVSPGQRFRLQAPPGIRVASALLEPDDARAFAGDLAACVHHRPLRFD
jgi:DNA-binding transcriptional MocR family regulator